MNTLASRCIDTVIGVEGGYSNNPSDSGGSTIWGITEAVARAYGYRGDMRDMPRSTAVDIFKARYWDTLSLDAISAVSEKVAYELFDTGVNLGVAEAGKFLQRSLNVLSDNGAYYAAVKVDGLVGAMTVAALKAYMLKRYATQGEVVLLRALNALQGSFYIELAENRTKDQDFVFGWLRNRVT